MSSQATINRFKNDNEPRRKPRTGETATDVREVNFGAEDSRSCRNCGSHVSERFTRIFGNNDNELYCCLECGTFRDLQEGKGARP